MDPKSDFASLMEGTQHDPETVRTRRRWRVGESVSGTVVQIGKDSIFVDIGGTSEARIERSEFADKAGKLHVQVGDTVRASVAAVGDGGPTLVLAMGRSGKGTLDVSLLREAREAKLPVQGKVTRAVKGGVEVELAGLRAFCPASQLDTTFVADPAGFEGQSLEFLVVEIKDDGRSVVLSRRALLEQARARVAEGVVQRLAVGGEYEGKVSSLQKYGAFIDLGGGVEGLIHISELAHGRTERVEDVLTVGDTVSVKVLAIEPQDKSPVPRLRLSLKALQAAPELPAVAPDEVLDGVVVKVGSVGVWVQTAKGQGLVPGRELGIPRGSEPRKAFPVGKAVKVVLVYRDPSGKSTFSFSRVAGVEESANYREFTRGGPGQAQAAPTMGNLGELFRQKLGLPEVAPERTSPSPAGPLPAAQPLPRGVTAPEPLQPSPAPAVTSQPEAQAPEPSGDDASFRGAMESGTLPAGVFRRQR